MIDYHGNWNNKKVDLCFLVGNYHLDEISDNTIFQKSRETNQGIFLGFLRTFSFKRGQELGGGLCLWKRGQLKPNDYPD